MKRFSAKKLKVQLCACCSFDQFARLAMRWEPRCRSEDEWDLFCRLLDAAISAWLHSSAKAGIASIVVILHDEMSRRELLAAMIGSHFAGAQEVISFIAAIAGMDRMVGNASDDVAALRLAIKWGISVDGASLNGCTALHYYAAMEDTHGAHPRAIRLLLDAGANPNAVTMDGDTPLCFLCCQDRWTPKMAEVLSMLLDRGADLNHSAKDGKDAIAILIDADKKWPHAERAKAIDTLIARKGEPIKEACVDFNHQQPVAYGMVASLTAQIPQNRTLRI